MGKSEAQSKGSNRRQFLGRVSMAAAAAGVVGKIPKAMAGTVTSSSASSGAPANTFDGRLKRAYNLRVNSAQADFSLAQPPHTTNGDEQRYSDKSASYSKGLLQDDIGVVNPAAWLSFKKALRSGDPNDWNNIILGGTRTENGPQGAYALDLEAADWLSMATLLFSTIRAD